MLYLFLQRRFLPFFICQFLGALNDSLFRLALVAMVSFGALKSDNAGVYIQLAAALFMLPFLLLSPVAGEIADTIGKRTMLRISKAAECGIMTLAALAVYWQNLPLIFFALFLTGVQSAFFGPVKYALLPSLLNPKELLSGNALFGVSTFASILLGTFFGTIAGQSPDYTIALSVAFVVVSLAGFAGALFVPPANNDEPQGKFVFQPWRAGKEVLALVHGDKPIFYRVLAASWFWLVAVLLLNELPHLGKDAYYLSLTAVFVGAGIGAIGCRLLYHNTITTKYAPLLLLISGLLLFGIAKTFQTFTPTELMPQNFALLGLLVLFAAAMICYVVPLRTSIQAIAPEESRARIIAAYNLYNALFIVIAALAAAGLRTAYADTTPNTVLFITCLLTLVAVVPVCLLLPLETLRNLLRRLCRLLFRVTISGEEHLDKGNTVIISNHTSFLDAFLLSVFLEKSPHRRFCFAIDVEQAKRPMFRPFLKLVTYFALNPMEPHGIRGLIKEIRRNDTLRPIVFPEGRITTTGNLMKSYPGAGVIAMKISDGNIVPIHISGAVLSRLSKMKGKVRQQWFPKIHITVGAPKNVSAPATLRGRRQREWIANKITQLLEDTAFHAQDTDTNLTRAFARGNHEHGISSPLFAEAPATHLNRRGAYRASVALGKLIKAHHPADNTPVGLLLPTSVGAAVTFWGAIFYRLVPVMLNPSAGKRQVLSACQTATVKTVYTAERLLKLSPPTAEIVAALREQGVEIITLESLREKITLPIKLAAAFAGFLPAFTVKRLPGFAAQASDTACVLFTSGSEGSPKGVVLSHRNLYGNTRQILTRIDVTSADTLTNTLPIFHSFGLIVGVVLPVIVGVKAWQYPSPLHYRLIPEVVYGSNASIFFSTDTFLRNYGLAAHPIDFNHLRLVFAGAEKLKDSTRKLWADKFGVRILEGYGVTETAPALSFNAPAHCKFGTVGRILPGIETRLEAVEGIQRGGRLSVRGVNVMRGYYLADAPSVIQPPPDGWHDTGDIADLDEDGYITILGRAKRFVKIAGEMVPLDGVEEHLKTHWQDAMFALVGLVDERRGEMLGLMTTADLDREKIGKVFRADGMSDLWVPRIIKIVKEIPLLPTGKVNYPAVTEALQK